MDELEQVRAIVDARIAELRRRREPWWRAIVANREERGRADGSGPCGMEMRMMAEAPICCASTPMMLERLPENLPVPSAEPRPPNLHAVNLSFAARLVIAVRDRFGGDAPKVYAAARVSRQAYSQIVSDETRTVSKRTAIRFAFALKSTPEEARLLLKSAGYAFSNSLTEDFILQACLEVNPPIWDFEAVNRLLREYRVDFQY